MGTKENQKKSRMKRQHKRPEPQPYDKAPTMNGRDIQSMLVAAGKKPAHYKDWCIHATGRLIDWVGSYSVEGSRPVEGAMLIHKSKLEYFGEPFARQLWNKPMGRRVHQKHPDA